MRGELNLSSNVLSSYPIPTQRQPLSLYGKAKYDTDKYYPPPLLSFMCVYCFTLKLTGCLFVRSCT